MTEQILRSPSGAPIDATAIIDGTPVGGDLSQTLVNPWVIAFHESGGDRLAIGGIADLRILQRVGLFVVGITQAAVVAGVAVGGVLAGTLPNPSLASGVLKSALAFGATNTGNAASPTARFYPPGVGNGAATAAVGAQAIMPYAGIVTDMFVTFGTVLAAANTIFTLMKNGVATALTLTINATVLSGSVSGGSVAFVAGDLLTIQSVTSVADATTSQPRIGIAYTIT